MDSSTYIPDQQSPMLQLTDPNANPNNQPVNYGGTIWEVLNSVAHSTGGAQYLIGISLIRSLYGIDNSGTIQDSLFSTPIAQTSLYWRVRLVSNSNLSRYLPCAQGDAKKNLGNNLDAFLLGNVSSGRPPSRHRPQYVILQEPDLYTAHSQRPNLANYTTGNYMDVS